MLINEQYRYLLKGMGGKSFGISGSYTIYNTADWKKAETLIDTFLDYISQREATGLRLVSYQVCKIQAAFNHDFDLLEKGEFRTSESHVYGWILYDQMARTKLLLYYWGDAKKGKTHIACKPKGDIKETKETKMKDIGKDTKMKFPETVHASTNGLSEEHKRKHRVGSIDLVFTRQFTAGKLQYKLLNIDGVADYCDLPKEYTATAPFVFGRRFTSDPTTFIKMGNSIRTPNGGHLFVVDDYYTESVLQAKLKYLAQCGSRLHAINAKLRKEKSQWTGTFHVQI